VSYRSPARAPFLFLRHLRDPFHGLDAFVRADTMLFILGLTRFVSVVAQTRLLEGWR
jgi:hypothetical protein